MNTALIVVSVACLSINAVAQDTTGAYLRAIAKSFSTTQSFNTYDSALSEFPTAKEVVALFRTHGTQLDIAYEKVRRRGDNAIPAVMDLLTGRVDRSSISVGDTGVSVPSSYELVRCLIAVHSPRAMAAILDVGASSREEQVRLLSLEALVSSFWEGMDWSKQEPPIAVAEVMVRNLEYPGGADGDPVAVRRTARLGVLRWLGIDFGDPQYSDDRTVAGNNKGELTPEKYAALWLSQNKERLRWNPSTEHFDVK